MRTLRAQFVCVSVEMAALVLLARSASAGTEQLGDRLLAQMLGANQPAVTSGPPAPMSATQVRSLLATRSSHPQVVRARELLDTEMARRHGTHWAVRGRMPNARDVHVAVARATWEYVRYYRLLSKVPTSAALSVANGSVCRRIAGLLRLTDQPRRSSDSNSALVAFGQVIVADKPSLECRQRARRLNDLVGQLQDVFGTDRRLRQLSRTTLQPVLGTFTTPLPTRLHYLGHH